MFKFYQLLPLEQFEAEETEKDTLWSERYYLCLILLAHKHTATCIAHYLTSTCHCQKRLYSMKLC